MYKSQFFDDAYQKARAAIEAIDVESASDIYALSFWKMNDNDDPRYPMIILSYNTESQVNAQQSNASGADEARWNYAFWLQEDMLILGGEDDEDYYSWLRSTSFYYSDESIEQAEESNDEEKLNDQDNCSEHIQTLFMDNIIAIAKKLHQHGVIQSKFDEQIPIIIHELEYYDLPISWSKCANPLQSLTGFLQWYDAMTGA